MGNMERGIQFFEELDGAVVGFRRRLVAFLPSLGDAARLVGVEFGELVVQLDPFVPFHGS